MFANRKTITAINALKELWGPDRFAQTNDRRNGNFIKWVRLYDSPEDKRRRNKYRCTTFYDVESIERRVHACRHELNK